MALRQRLAFLLDELLGRENLCHMRPERSPWLGCPHGIPYIYEVRQRLLQEQVRHEARHMSQDEGGLVRPAPSYRTVQQIPRAGIPKLRTGTVAPRVAGASDALSTAGPTVGGHSGFEHGAISCHISGKKPLQRCCRPSRPARSRRRRRCPPPGRAEPATQNQNRDIMDAPLMNTTPGRDRTVAEIRLRMNGADLPLGQLARQVIPGLKRAVERRGALFRLSLKRV